MNLGYEEGVRAGQADREDGFRGDYRSSYAYQDANYGYTGMYVGQTDYNYYFREGFRRGYEDGYNSSYRYGSNIERHAGNPEHRPVDHPQPAAAPLGERGASPRWPPSFPSARAAARRSTSPSQRRISARSASISRACTCTAATVMLVYP